MRHITLAAERRFGVARSQALLPWFQCRRTANIPQLDLEEENHSSAASSAWDKSKASTASNYFTRVFSSQLSDGKKDACMEYVRGWAWQQAVLSRRLHLRRSVPTNSNNTLTRHVDDEIINQHDDEDYLILLEHSPVYTLGRGADVCHLTFLAYDENCSASDSKYHALSRNCRGEESARLAMNRAMDHFINGNNESLKQEDVIDTLISMVVTCPPVHAPNQVPIYRVERGGEVTFHGPGQLVVYPLLDLKRPPYQQDLHWYVRSIEQVIIQCLEHYDIESTRDPDNTGVWVGDDKIAAVGVSASRWITTHGFALNVCPDLQYFDTSVILPCGIPEKGVTSMAQLLQDRGVSNVPSVSEVAGVVLNCFEQVFGVQVQSGEGIR